MVVSFWCMEVFIERTRERRSVGASSVSELLSSLGIVPDEVLVMRNGSLATEDEVLEESDEVRVLSVISGG